MQKQKLLWIILMLILSAGILFWSPWLSAEEAGEKVAAQFEQNWQGIADGCGFYCKGCGVVHVDRALMGYNVQLEYACGMLPADEPQYHDETVVYVSPFGTVHGLRKP